MLRAKSEVPTIIIWFIDLIFNQFDKRLRIFRSDNAKEYFSNEVNSYMENHGIIHESSCVNTPNKMGLRRGKLDTLWHLQDLYYFREIAPRATGVKLLLLQYIL